MNNFSPELIEKAKAAKNAEELLEIAKANGVDLTPDEAAAYFVQLGPKSGELDDDDLETVAGGAGGCGDPTNKDLFPEDSKLRYKKGSCPVCQTNVWIAKYSWSIELRRNIITPTCSSCGRTNGTYMRGSRDMSDYYELIG